MVGEKTLCLGDSWENLVLTFWTLTLTLSKVSHSNGVGHCLLRGCHPLASRNVFFVWEGTLVNVFTPTAETLTSVLVVRLMGDLKCFSFV